MKKTLDRSWHPSRPVSYPPLPWEPLSLGGGVDDGGGEAGHFFCRTITPLNLRRPTHSQAPQPTFHLEFLKELRAFISLPTLSFDFLGTIAFLCRSLSEDRASVAAVREKRYLEQVPTQTVHLHLVSHSTTCEDSFFAKTSFSTEYKDYRHNLHITRGLSFHVSVY